MKLAGQVVGGHSQAQVVALRTLGDGHVFVQTHCPLTQPLLVPVQATPHCPQLVAVLLPTQPPSQHIWPAPQVVLFGSVA